jgi:hypothetical protein
MPSITLKTHTSGDTWRGLAMTVTLNGTPLDLTGATVLMQMRKLAASVDVAYEWKSDGTGPQIQITDAAAGKVTIMKRTITGFGSLMFDIQVTTSDGVVRTVASGTLPITQDVSRV